MRIRFISRAGRGTAAFIQAAVAGSLVSLASAPMPACADTAEAAHVFKGAHAGGTLPQGSLLAASDGDLWGATSFGGQDDDGVVFKMSTDGTFQSVTGVPLSVGRNFVGDFTQTDDGTIWAVTNLGGEFNAGSILAISPVDGSVRPVYSFDPSGWGGQPVSGLTQASDGYLYGVILSATPAVYRLQPSTGAWSIVATLPGNGVCSGYGPRLVEGSDGALFGLGAGNSGCVYRVTPRGTVKLVHTFKRDDAPMALIQGSDGHLYGTVRERYHQGNPHCGAIFAMTTSGKTTVLHDFACSRNGKQSFPVGGFVQGADGTFHGNAQHYKANGGGTYDTVWSMNADGSAFTETRVRTRVGGAFRIPVQASDGNYYATAPGGKYDQGTIVRITP